MKINNIVVVSPSPQHAVIKNRLCELLGKLGYCCYHVTTSKEAYDWLITKTNKAYYLIDERDKYVLTKDTESYLIDIEHKYNVSSKRILSGDIDHSRIDRSKAFKYMVQEFMFWEDFITNNNIDLIISDAERFLNMIPNSIMNSKKKTTFYITASIDSNSFRITKDPINTIFEIKYIFEHGKFTQEELDNAEHKLNELKEQKQMVGHSSKVPRAFGRPDLDLYNIFYGIKRYIKQITVEKNKNVYGNIIQISIDKVWQAIRKHISKLNYCDYNVMKKTKFFFYPLHASIDAQVVVRCPQYRDQNYMIEYIAKSLPAGYNLLVKEHPMYPGLVPIKEMNAISNLPNVYFINPKLNSHNVILDSSGVIAINSTTGWESLYHGKPTIILGKPYYSVMKQGWKVTDLFNLPDIFLKSQTEARMDKDELIRFTAGMLRLSYPGQYLGYITARLAAPISLNEREKVLDQEDVSILVNQTVEAIDKEIHNLDI